MLIAFKDIGSPGMGSSRIYGYYLSSLLEELGHECPVNLPLSGREDIIVVGKGSGRAPAYKLRSPGALVGAINPSLRRAVTPGIDFFLVGSIEESLSLAFTKKPRILFPQIEPDLISPKKTHRQENLSVVYHGNLEHLQQLSKGLRRGLIAAHKRVPFELVLIYNWQSLGFASLSLPRTISVKHVQWKLESFMADIRDGSIGISPASAPKPLVDGIRSDLPRKSLREHHLISVKRLSNVGRALLMSQLGIPVVAELSPSALALYPDPRRGLVASNAESWEESLVYLLESADARARMARNALDFVRKDYNPKIWASSVAQDFRTLLEKG